MSFLLHRSLTSCVAIQTAIYLYGMYHLPNREYYAQLHGMTENELVQTLKNVLFYCSLQLVSLMLLFYALQRQLGFSPFTTWRSSWTNSSWAYR